MDIDYDTVERLLQTVDANIAFVTLSKESAFRQTIHLLCRNWVEQHPKQNSGTSLSDRDCNWLKSQIAQSAEVQKGDVTFLKEWITQEYNDLRELFFRAKEDTERRLTRLENPPRKKKRPTQRRK